MRVHRYPEEKRIATTWNKDGVSHRTNTIKWGGVCPLHAHVGDHDLEVTNGNFVLNMVDPKGVKSESYLQKGDKIVVPAYWKHTLIPTLIPSIEPQVWEFDCSWDEERTI